MKKKMYEAPNLQLFMGMEHCVLLDSQGVQSGEDTFVPDIDIL